MSRLPLFRYPDHQRSEQPLYSMAIGVFDGLHRGHRALLSRLPEEGTVPAVLTFFPPPARFFRDDQYPGDIMTPRLKRLFLKRLGIDQLFTIDFSSDFSKLGGGIFLNSLEDSFRISRLVVGEDFRLGKDREVDFSGLVQWGRNRGIRVESAPSVMDGDQKISSTRIRNAVATGDAATAVRLLGGPLALDLLAGDWACRPDGLCRYSPDREGGVIPLPPGRYRGGRLYRNGFLRLDLTVQGDTGEILWEEAGEPAENGENIIYVYEQKEE